MTAPSVPAGARAARRPRPLLVIGIALVGFWAVAALFAPFLAPFGLSEQVLPFAPPGARAPDGRLFVLGSDALGRDVLSRTLYGARTVLVYAPLAAFLAYASGLAAGLAAGFYRGWVDEVLSQLAGLVMSFPVMVLYLLLLSVAGASSVNILLAVVVGGAPAIMRLTRGLVLEQAERGYVAAARLRGEPDWYILAVEILPNIRRTIAVDLCLRLSYVIVTIGTLGFLGLGLPPPNADWGSMINENRNFAMVFPMMVLAPTLAIITLVLGINIVADELVARGGR